ncbi:catechol 1,2-dioxygenase [Flavisphingomonas formosensis]|uniref:catechol 1,2-dioxygenase n=1 Tax=Flavisphingomonas formosensis TaxID=861534 RepID=UPI0012F8F46B|nr:catechol 1,2-dioxygenase [Sphingomonas formosensis]
MASRLVQTPEIQKLLDRVSGLTVGGGDPRTKQIVRRIVSDLYTTIDEFDITPDEFWGTLGFLQQGAMEFGLIAPGLGFDHFLDIRMDEADKAAGIEGGTPRTIEGPLYVPGAPLAKGFARLDDGTDKGEVLVMHGRVTDQDGQPVAGAIVDVWHANTLGNYSYFDKSQTDYNNRRRIETDAEGKYKFHSIVPSGYAVPPQGTTERLLGSVGRHGNRPAHIHFFVSAPGYRHLTTQINIAGDPFLYDDFAQATREGLIPDVVRHEDAEAIRAEGLNTPFAEIDFGFTLVKARSEAEGELHARPRVPPIA